MDTEAGQTASMWSRRKKEGKKWSREAEDECEGRKVEEHRRGAEEVGSRSGRKHGAEEEVEEGESRESEEREEE